LAGHYLHREFPNGPGRSSSPAFRWLPYPARLAVFDTRGGQIVASPTIVKSSDDLFFDTNRDRIYVLGEGSYSQRFAKHFIEDSQEKDADHYEPIRRYATPYSDHTGLVVPELRELFEAVPHRGEQPAEMLVYEAK